MRRRSDLRTKLDGLEGAHSNVVDGLRGSGDDGPKDPIRSSRVRIRDFRPRDGSRRTLYVIVETGHLAGVIVGDGGRHLLTRFVGG